MKNKRGDYTSIIIYLVLGVIVLVILAIGFTKGWGTLASWIQSKNNIDQEIQSCSMACSIQSQFSFCDAQRELKSESFKNTDGKIYGTCNSFAEYLSQYKFPKCSGLCSGEAIPPSGKKSEGDIYKGETSQENYKGETSQENEETQEDLCDPNKIHDDGIYAMRACAQCSPRPTKTKYYEDKKIVEKDCSKIEYYCFDENNQLIECEK